MQLISSGYDGARLLIVLNWDRLLFSGVLVLALSASSLLDRAQASGEYFSVGVF